MQLPTHPRIWREVRQLPPGPARVDARGRTLPPGADPVCPTIAGEHFKPVNFGVQPAGRLRGLGLQGVTLHRFRHSFGTNLFLPAAEGGGGANARTAQELLGHRSLSSTQIYAQVTEQQRRRAIESLRLPGEEAA
jgi:integrase